jgi:hypothetical protein
LLLFHHCNSFIHWFFGMLLLIRLWFHNKIVHTL